MFLPVNTYLGLYLKIYFISWFMYCLWQRNKKM